MLQAKEEKKKRAIKRKERKLNQEKPTKTIKIVEKVGKVEKG